MKQSGFSNLAFPLLAAIWLVMLLGGGMPSVADRSILLSLYAGDRPFLAQSTALLTQLGGGIALLCLTATGAAWLAFKNRTRDALLFFAISIGGRLLVEGQKLAFHRSRPVLSEHLVSVYSLSFPSAHSANSMIVYLLLALFLAPRRHWIAAAIALSLVIGFSRMLLAVHWPSDVLGGWSFGLFWTLGLVRLVGIQGTARPLRH
jgi:undecaprenyl-diphosphatase